MVNTQLKILRVFGPTGAEVSSVLRGIRDDGCPGLRLLAVDDVTPSNDTIASESYPLCNEFYAVLHADATADSPERQLYDWLDTAAGQDCIKKSGYVAVAPATGTTVD
jgi:phosphate transport system substrate-binding protein